MKTKEALEKELKEIEQKIDDERNRHDDELQRYVSNMSFLKAKRLEIKQQLSLYKEN